MPRAQVNGKMMAFSDVEPLMGTLPPGASRDPEAVFRTYGFLDLMATKGETEKLYNLSPFKEQLDMARKQILAQAVMQRFYDTVEITDEEIKAYWEKHKDEYATAGVQCMMIPARSKEEQAAAEGKARDAGKALKDGTNLAMMFAQYPCNLTTIGRTDPAVDASIRKAVFALKPGEITAPVTLPSGIYVIRVDTMTSGDFDKLKPNVRKSIADARFNDFMEEVRKSVTVTMVKK